MVRRLLLLVTLLGCATPALATDYHIGPGQAYTTIGAVPWYSLVAGDTVYLHCKSPNTPYYEKLLISTIGTSLNWFTFEGVSCSGAKPIISGNGATTSSNMHHHYTDASGGSAIQDKGLVQVALTSDEKAISNFTMPAYVQIKNIELQDVGSAYSFTAENGMGATFDGFAACIYANRIENLIVENVTAHNCGQGVFVLTGDVSGGAYYERLAKNIVVKGSYFYDNGIVGGFGNHQVYVQGERCTVEYNYFGPVKAGMKGNQYKDRCSGTIVRYNRFIQSPEGYNLDLVETQDSPSLISTNLYKQTFVYGNLFVNQLAPAALGAGGSNNIHWNEDHQGSSGNGRAAVTGGVLLYYNNTYVIVADADTDFSTNKITLFNMQWGSFDCPPVDTIGIVKLYNNIFYAQARQGGHSAVEIRLSRCTTNLVLGKNWINSGWVSGIADYPSTTVTGSANMVSPGGSPSFTTDFTDLHLAAMSSARSIGGALPSEVTANHLGLDLTPTAQYVYDQSTTTRSDSGVTDVGAFSDSESAPTPSGVAVILGRRLY